MTDTATDSPPDHKQAQDQPREQEQELEQDAEQGDQPILTDSEAVFSLVERGIGITIGAAVIAVSWTFGVYHVTYDRPIQVFISAMLGWSGYMFAHYAATGTFIHQSQEQRLLPKSSTKILGGLFGTVILVGGTTIWVISLHRADLTPTLLGAFAAILGYLITHYEFTGTIL